MHAAQSPDASGRLADALARLAAGAPADAPPYALALSGGIDSRLLAAFSRHLGLMPLLVHIGGPHVPAADTRSARDTAGLLGLPLAELALDPLALPQVAHNRLDRCYHCKRHLFTAVRELAARHGARVIIEGSHASDAQGYRPGRVALTELGIESPLAKAGLSKADVRRLAARIGLAAPDQPSRACLLTRFAYDLPATAELLAALDATETALAGLGLRDFRVRLLPGGRIVLQVAAAEQEAFQALGLDRAALSRFLAPLGGATVETAFTASVSGYFDTP